MRFFLLLAVALPPVAMSCRAATAQPPDPKEIVQRSVLAIEADWSLAPGYSFQERDVESKHDAPPTVKTYEVLMIDGAPYNRLIAIDDHALSEDDRAEEDRKLHVEIFKRQHESNRERSKRVAKYEKDRRRDHAMLMDMVDAFDFQLVGAETVDGHACWVLDARPKRGYQPKDHETKVLAGMRGQLWVDQSQYQWVRVKAEVFKPVSFFGFIAKVGPGTSILLEQEPVADNLWLPKRFSMHVKASALGFLDESSTDDETYREYKLIPKTSAGLVK
jgi:hypothetical protein